MNASKENAVKALNSFNSLSINERGSDQDEDIVIEEDIKFVRDFLEAAKRKLPSEKSHAKDKRRKRTKA